jgi:FKBP-type peptidyl-prolyl cis-trans isomerase SlyD
MRTPDGQTLPLTISVVKNDCVTVDGNHALAGQTLHFEVEVRDVRAATADELAHGHVHGPGGEHD